MVLVPGKYYLYNHSAATGSKKKEGRREEQISKLDFETVPCFACCNLIYFITVYTNQKLKSLMNSKNNSKISNPYSKRTYENSTSKARNQPNTQSDHRNIDVDAQTTGSFSQEFGHVNLEFNPESHAANSRKRSMEEMSSIGGGTNEMNSTNIQQALDQNASAQPHVLLVSTRQRGNTLLRFIRNVPFTFVKMVPDFIIGPNRCAIFLSFKYHNLHPNYIHRRIAELKSDFDLRVLLCLVDVEDNAAILLKMNKMCAVNSLTLVLGWSEEECARYLESFKAYENKDSSLIQKKKDVTYTEQVNSFLGSVRSVNKTDSSQLLMQFGNLKSLVTASMEDLRHCPGIGEKKVRRLFDAFNKPFSSLMAEKRKEEKEQLANIERDIANIEEEETISEGVDDNEDKNQSNDDGSEVKELKSNDTS